MLFAQHSDQSQCFAALRLSLVRQRATSTDCQRQRHSYVCVQLSMLLAVSHKTEVRWHSCLGSTCETVHRQAHIQAPALTPVMLPRSLIGSLHRFPGLPDPLWRLTFMHQFDNLTFISAETCNCDCMSTKPQVFRETNYRRLRSVTQFRVTVYLRVCECVHEVWLSSSPSLRRALLLHVPISTSARVSPVPEHVAP